MASRRVKKAGLNIQKTKILAPNLITSRQAEGEKEEAVTDFIFLNSKVIADGECSHEIKDACSLKGKL